MAEEKTERVEEQSENNGDLIDTFLEIPSHLISEISIILLLGVLFLVRKLVKNSMVDWQKEFLSNFNQNNDLLRCAIEMRAASDADRVVISQFTNGELSSTGLPFLKLRIRTESHLSGLKEVSKVINSNTIDLESVPYDIKEIFDNHQLVIEDINKENTYKGIFNLHQIRETSCYNEMIYLGRTHVGIISIFFNKPLDKEKIDYLKNDPLFVYYKEELKRTLAPQPNKFMRLVDWIF